jgi:hypothetical protein
MNYVNIEIWRSTGPFIMKYVCDNYTMISTLVQELCYTKSIYN